MINKNKMKIMVLILLLFSLPLIISSVNAAEKTLTPSNDINLEIKNAPSNSIINLDPSKGEFNLNSSISINKIVTIKSSNPSKNAVINLNKKNRAFYINNTGKLTLINITIKKGNASEVVQSIIKLALLI